MHVAERFEEALAAYSAAAGAPDTSPLIVRTCLEKSGRLHLSLGDLDAAGAAAEELRTATPHTGVADVLAAELAIASGDPARAIELLDGVTDYQDTFVFTTDAEISALRGLALVLVGRPADGAREAARAIHDEPDNAEAWFVVAVASSRGAPEAPDLAARALAPSHLVPALGRVLALADPHADGIAEALWGCHHDQPALHAAAELLANRLTGTRAQAWSARAAT
jgi:hypothetical protein